MTNPFPGIVPPPESAARAIQRKANAPLKPKAEQKPCDVGLFSDDRDQLDLVDQARRK